MLYEKFNACLAYSPDSTNLKAHVGVRGRILVGLERRSLGNHLTVSDNQPQIRMGGSPQNRSRADPVVILEDFGDQLNRIYTPLLILLLAGIAAIEVYFLRPITCNIPALPGDDFRGFAESVCWSSGAIRMDKNDEIPEDEAGWEKLQGRSGVCKCGQETSHQTGSRFDILVFRHFSIPSMGAILFVDSSNSLLSAVHDLEGSMHELVR